MLVSILIPCLNGAEWLGGAIESALAQSWPRCEVIVVDDGSSDTSLAVARRFESRGVTVIAQANRGAAAARNAALRASRGDWIQYLDADDLLAPDKIARQLAAAGPAAAGRLLTGRWGRFADSPAAARFKPEPLSRDAAPIDWMIIKLERHAMMHPAAWLSPRALVDRAGPWDERLSLDDDGEYFSRLVLLSSEIRHCPEAVSYYRTRRRGSLSRSRSEPAWASALRSLELTAGRLLALEDSPRTRHAAAAAGQRLIYEAYPDAPGVRRRAAGLVREWGGARVAPLGGPQFRRLSRLIGWRLARRLQVAFKR